MYKNIYTYVQMYNRINVLPRKDFLKEDIKLQKNRFDNFCLIRSHEKLLRII